MATGNRYDWARVGKGAFLITVGSLLSMALFGLLYWAFGLGNIRFSIRVLVAIAWVATTVILMRKSAQVVRNQPVLSLIYFVWAVGLIAGLASVGDWAHRSMSSFYQCDSLTKGAIAGHEYIQARQPVEVDTGKVGYFYYYDTRSSTRNPKEYITFKACVAAPVKGSKGVYTVYQVKDKEHSFFYGQQDMVAQFHHDFCAALRDTLQHHRYDAQCRTFRIITPQNSDDYERYMRAVEDASIMSNDTAFSVQSNPVIIKPVDDVQLGSQARVEKGNVILFLISQLLVWLALFLSYALSRKAKGVAERDSDLIDDVIKFVKTPANWSGVLIVILLVAYYVTATAMGYTHSSMLLDYGAITGYHLITLGEWWRLLTSMLMHADFMHLALNLIALGAALALFGKLLQGWRGLLVFFGTGIVGALCSAIYSDGIVTGASGAIMGMYGYCISAIFFDKTRAWRMTYGVSFTVAIVFVGFTMVSSVLPGVSLSAHLAGFLSGGVAGAAYVRWMQRNIPGDEDE